MMNQYRKTLLRSALLVWVSMAGAVTPVKAQSKPAAQQETVDYLALSRDLLTKYYETEKLLGQEQADWKLNRELLKNRVELMEAQLKELETKTEEERGKITQSDAEREKLDQQNQELAKLQTVQVGAIEKLEARIRLLWPKLPEVLKAKVRGQYERLPAAGLPRDQIKSSVGERFLNVLAVLNEATKFHGDVLVVSERRKLRDGRELEVETIYFGLSVAYFASGDSMNPAAGMLLPTESGWETIEMPEHAVAISDVIAMNKSAKIAGFVPLPVKVK